MGKLIKTDGTIKDVKPENGKFYTLKEMQDYVDGYIQVIDLGRSGCMIVDEEGKIRGKAVNVEATKKAIKHLMFGDFIVGDVLICRKGEVR